MEEEELVYYDNSSANAEFIQNIQSAVDSTGVVGRVEEIQTENGPVTVIFMDEGADTNTILNFTDVNSTLENDNSTIHYEVVDSELVTETVPHNAQDVISEEIIPSEEIVTSTILSGFGTNVEVEPEYTALPLNIGQAYKTSDDRQTCEPYDTGQDGNINVPNGGTVINTIANHAELLAAMDIASPEATSDTLITTTLPQYSVPITPQIIRIKKPTREHKPVSNQVFTTRQGVNLSEQFLRNENLITKVSKRIDAKNQFNASQQLLTSGFLNQPTIPLSEELQAVESIVDNETKILSLNNENSGNVSYTGKAQSLLVTRDKPFSAQEEKLSDSTTVRSSMVRQIQPKIRYPKFETVKKVQPVFSPVVKYAPSSTISIVKPPTSGNKGRVMRTSAGTQTVIHVSKPAQIQQEPQSQQSTIMAHNQDHIISNMSADYSHHTASMAMNQEPTVSKVMQDHVIVQRKPDGVPAKASTKVSSSQDRGVTVTLVDSHGQMVSKSVNETIVSKGSVTIPSYKPVQAKSVRYTSQATPLAYKQNIQTIMPKSIQTQPMRKEPEMTFVRTEPQVIPVSTQPHGSNLVRTEPQISHLVTTKPQGYTVSTESQLSLPQITDQILQPIKTELPPAPPVKPELTTIEPFTTSLTEHPVAESMEPEGVEPSTSGTKLPASSSLETQAAPETGNLQTIEVPDSDVTIQIFGDGTLVTSDKAGTKYSKINLDSLGLDKHMLQGDTNIELVIVQADGKEVKASIQTNLQALQNTVQNSQGESDTQSTDFNLLSNNATGESLVTSDSTAKDITKGSRPYQCSKCPRTFKFEKTFKSHEKVHEQAVVYTCSICSRAFAKEENLNSHIDLHKKIEKTTVSKTVPKQMGDREIVEYKCKDCGKIFISPVNFSRHILQMCHNSGWISCPKCGKEYSSEKCFQSHMKKHVGPHLCPCCGQIFKNNEDLMSHTKKEHPDDALICTVCDEIFKSKAVLSLHLQHHQQEGDKMRTMQQNKQKCTECGKTFLQQHLLKKHMNTHSADRAFQCPYCTLKFGSKWAMTKHMVHVHNKNGIDCEKCGIKFKRRDFYETHNEQYHKGPYKCENCGEIYQEKRELMSHEFTVHGMGVTCPVCGAKFERKIDLMKHKDREHRKPANVLCDICGAGFVHKAHLKTHLVKEHFEGNKEEMLNAYPNMRSPAEPCEICKEVLRTKAASKVHYLNMHYNGNQEAMYKAHPHLKTYPPVTEVLECDHCGKLFSKMSSLQAHLKSHGINKSPQKHKTSGSRRESPEIEQDIEQDIEEPDVEQDIDEDQNYSHPRDAEKKYRCHIKKCKYRFARKASLLKHLKCHEIDYSLLAIRQLEHAERERAKAEEREGVQPSPKKKAKPDVSSKTTSIKSPKPELKKAFSTKHKRGRPRKRDEVALDTPARTEQRKQIKDETEPNQQSQTVHEKRGRPRKKVRTEPPKVEKRSRGRPLKVIKSEIETEEIKSPKQGGRHRKIPESKTYKLKQKTKVEAVTEKNSHKDRRGRPAKVVPVTDKSRRDRREKSAKAGAVKDKTLNQGQHGKLSNLKRKREEDTGSTVVSKKAKIAAKKRVKRCINANVQFKCKLCRKSYRTASSLAQHVQVKHREKRKRAKPKKSKVTENHKSSLKDASPVPVDNKEMDIETFLGNHLGLGKKRASVKEEEPQIDQSQENEVCDQIPNTVVDNNEHIDSNEVIDKKEIEGSISISNNWLGYQVAKYPCRECGNMYGTSMGLVNHCKSRHTDVDIDTVQAEIAEIDKATVTTTGHLTDAYGQDILGSKSDTILDESQIKQEKKEGEKKEGIIKFCCKICFLEYLTSEELNKHLKIFHPIIQDKKETQTSTNTAAHVKDKSIKERGEFKCTICFKGFSEEINLRRHVTVKHSIGKKCSSTNSPARVKDKSVKDGGEFSCNICYKGFSEEINLRRHLKVKHNITKKRSSPNTPTQVKKRIKTKREGFSCAICFKGFAEEINLNRHMKMKHYIGKQCSTTKDSKAANGNHKELKKDKKIPGLKCPHCNKTFILQRNLITHMNKDHWNKMKTSEAKGKSLAKTDNKVSFQCKHCSKAFSKKMQLNVHIIRKHKHNLKLKALVSKPVLKKQCDRCNESFSSMESYRIHLRQKHIREMLTHPPSLKSTKANSKTVPDKNEKQLDSAVSSPNDFSKLKPKMRTESVNMPEMEETADECKASQYTEVTSVYHSDKQLAKPSKQKVRETVSSDISVENNCVACCYCKECKRVFWSNQIYKLHMEKLHPDTFALELDKRVMEQLSQAEVGTKKLDVTAVQLLSPKSRSSSMGIMKHTCKFCSRVNWTKRSFDEHMLKTHAEEVERNPEMYGLSPGPEQVVDTTDKTTKCWPNSLFVKFDKGALVNFDQLAAAPVVLLDQLPIEKLIRAAEEANNVSDSEILTEDDASVEDRMIDCDDMNGQKIEPSELFVDEIKVNQNNFSLHYVPDRQDSISESELKADQSEFANEESDNQEEDISNINMQVCESEDKLKVEPDSVNEEGKCDTRKGILEPELKDETNRSHMEVSDIWSKKLTTDRQRNDDSSATRSCDSDKDQTLNNGTHETNHSSQFHEDISKEVSNIEVINSESQGSLCQNDIRELHDGDSCSFETERETQNSVFEHENDIVMNQPSHMEEHGEKSSTVLNQSSVAVNERDDVESSTVLSQSSVTVNERDDVESGTVLSQSSVAVNERDDVESGTVLSQSSVTVNERDDVESSTVLSQSSVTVNERDDVESSTVLSQSSVTVNERDDVESGTVLSQSSVTVNERDDVESGTVLSQSSVAVNERDDVESSTVLSQSSVTVNERDDVESSTVLSQSSVTVNERDDVESSTVLSQSSVTVNERDDVESGTVLSQSSVAVNERDDVESSTVLSQSSVTVNERDDVESGTVLSQSSVAVNERDDVEISTVLSQSSVADGEKDDVESGTVLSQSSVADGEKDDVESGTVLSQSSVADGEKDDVESGTVLSRSSIADCERDDVESSAVLSQSSKTVTERDDVESSAVLSQSSLADGERDDVESSAVLSQSSLADGERDDVESSAVLSQSLVADGERDDVERSAVLSQSSVADGERDDVESSAVLSQSSVLVSERDYEESNAVLSQSGLILEEDEEEDYEIFNPALTSEGECERKSETMNQLSTYKEDNERGFLVNQVSASESDETRDAMITSVSSSEIDNDERGAFINQLGASNGQDEDQAIINRPINEKDCEKECDNITQSAPGVVIEKGVELMDQSLSCSERDEVELLPLKDTEGFLQSQQELAE